MLNTPHWQKISVEPEPFVAGKGSRSLQLIVCDDELDPSPALDLLVSFAVRSEQLAFFSPSGRVGGQMTVSVDESEVAYSFKDGNQTRAFVYGDWWKTSGPKEAAQVGVDAATLERRFFFVHEAATRDFIDGLVMPFDDCLWKRWRKPLSDAKLMTSEQAAALMGLYLRARGERMIEIEPSGAGIMVSEERMYLLGALAELPQYEVLHEAAGNTWRQTGNPTLAGLTDALAVRLGRALKARDYLQVRRRAPNIREIWSDVLYFFESLLICLQGALDATARLVHELFELPGTRRQANWGRKGWWSELEKSTAPTDAFNRGYFDDLDVLVGDLRNSIHGEVLTGELRQQVQPGDKPLLMGYSQLAVALDAELAIPVSEAADRRGGLARWAIYETYPDGAALIDPWCYSEVAIAATGEALSSLIATLVSNCFADTVPSPELQELWLGKEGQRKNAKVLFGLEQMPLP